MPMLKENNMKQEMILEIKEIMTSARRRAAREVNGEQLYAYWNIGRVIVEHEQGSEKRAQYGKTVLREVSKELTKEFGKGFSISNIYKMRQFYLDYSKFQTLSGKLTWSHYSELLSISDRDRRSFYEKECVRSGWSVRELKRQIATSLFERLLLSEGKANKEKVYELAAKGQELTEPKDIIKIPMSLSFWAYRRGRPCWKAIWKRLSQDSWKTSCWNWEEALCLSEDSSA